MTFEEQLGTCVLHEIEYDEEPQPYELGCAIASAHEKDPALTDEILIALCGWSYASLAEILRNQ